MSETIQAAASWLWGPPMLLLFLGVAVFLFVRLRAVQFTDFIPALRALRRPVGGAGDVSAYGALMTAVGGMVGNGNIAGVATAITAGGPGALFWMWVSGVFGMGSMYVESVLGVRYRKMGSDGLYTGGPMYYLRDGLGWKKVAAFFAAGLALKTLVATTSIQSNSIASVIRSEYAISPWVSCSVVAVLTGLVIVGGVRWVGRASGVLAPLMGAIYLLAALAVLVSLWDQIPGTIGLVLEHAFTPAAGVGGFAGAGVREAFRYGIARGVYSNEAGTGSAPIAHASAQTNDPLQQGSIAMLGVFFDTLIVATATGLVILSTGAWHSGLDSGALTAFAFRSVLGDVGGHAVFVASFLFGFSTLITWSFYGEQCTAFLFGAHARLPFRILYSVAILGGALGSARTTWAVGDLLNGVMAIPNLIALVFLSKEVVQLRLTKHRHNPDEIF